MPKRKKRAEDWVLYLHYLNLETTSNLGPHASRIYSELLASAEVGSWASVIILSATLIDVVANEQAGPITQVEGITLNKVLTSKNILWLRKKRNSIVHYEGPVDGMMGGIEQTKILSQDARKSFEILICSLKELFKNL